ASADEVVAGDLIRSSFPGRPWTLLFTVAAVELPPAGSPTAPPVRVDGAQLQRLHVHGTEPCWLRAASVRHPVHGHVHYLGPRGEHRVAPAAVGATGEDGLVRISLDGSGGSPPEPPVAPTDAPPRGALVRLVLASRTLWIDLADV